MAPVGTTPRTVSKAVSTLRSATALHNRAARRLCGCFHVSAGDFTRGPQTKMGRGWNHALHPGWNHRAHGAKSAWRARFHPRPNQSRAGLIQGPTHGNAYRAAGEINRSGAETQSRFGDVFHADAMAPVGTTPRTVSKAVSTLRSATALQNHAGHAQFVEDHFRAWGDPPSPGGGYAGNSRKLPAANSQLLRAYGNLLTAGLQTTEGSCARTALTR